MRSAGRATSFPRPRQVRPPVRVVYTHPAETASQPVQPALDPMPSLSSGSFPSSPSSESSSLTFAGAGGTPIPLDQLLNPTPGLGFDFSHLAAVNSGLAVRAFIDPVTQHELATVQQLPQEQPIGFFPTYAYGGEAPAVSGSSQPEVIVVQQPVAQPAAAAATTSPPTPAPAAAPPAPPLPVGVLYLVRRKGSVIHAIAFSQLGGQVIYITADGLRHSIDLSKLDIEATRQRNAEHGTFVHLSE
ncbi:MAG TPA: hypothetical protein VNJ12_05345 [Candidatus Dormibacteraeota bacterium]|nr:hypothetical protein [Candidatus Dormibacteraeota bacterium]